MKYGLPQEYIVNFTKGLPIRIKANHGNSEKLINAYLKLDAEYAFLFNFLATHKDNLEKRDGNIIFKDESNIELFNSRIKRIQDLGNDLSKINESINAVKNLTKREIMAIISRSELAVFCPISSTTQIK